MSWSASFPSGLCARCRHAETLSSRRSRFLRCRRSDSDPHFARYPHLPVIACAGYEPFELAPDEPPERFAR